MSFENAAWLVDGLIILPDGVVNTRLVSSHAGPAAIRSVVCRARCERRAWTARVSMSRERRLFTSQWMHAT